MSDFGSYITQLLNTTSYDAAFGVYNRYIESLNFHSVSYVFMPNALSNQYKLTPPRFSLSELFSKTFIEEYNEKGFQAHDYIVDAINNGEENCFRLWHQDRNNKNLSSEAKRIIDNAKYNHHMGNGCSILTRRSPHGIGTVSLIGDESDRLFERYIQEHSKTLYESTMIFNQYVITNGYEVDLFIIQGIFSALTKTEKKVLPLLVNGHSVPNIAKQLELSVGHIENLIRDMRMKIGGVTAEGKPAITKDKLISYASFMRINEALNDA